MQKSLSEPLDINYFEPIHQLDTEKTEETTLAPSQVKLLYLERTIKDIGKVKAMGCQTSDGFVVMKGSQISTKDAGFDLENSKRKRKSKYYWWNFAGRYSSFQSKLCGFFCHWAKLPNGLTSWKTKEGQTLKALEAADI